MNNGTPQGSIISPLLFNIMINDLPNPLDARILPSIYADDCAAWKAGKDVALLCRQLQQHLDSVITWTDTWGFKLSEEKSAAVLFTINKKLVDSVKLTIKGRLGQGREPSQASRGDLRPSAHLKSLISPASWRGPRRPTI